MKCIRRLPISGNLSGRFSSGGLSTGTIADDDGDSDTTGPSPAITVQDQTGAFVQDEAGLFIQQDP